VTDQASMLRERVMAAGIGTRTTPLPSRTRCIAVGSGKGGVGKTMISIGLAMGLIRLNRRVLIFDADLGLSNVDLQMGIDPRFTLQDVVFGTCSMQEATVKGENGLPDVIVSSSGAPELADMGAPRQQMLVDDLIRFAAQYDFLIIDVGAGIGRTVTTFLAAVPEVLTVVANEPTSIMDAYSLVKVVRQQSNSVSMMTVVNMVKTLDEGERLANNLANITERFLGFRLPLAGVVTHDPVVGDAIRAQTPLLRFAERSGPAQCLHSLAAFMARRADGARRPVAVGDDFFARLADLSTQPKPGGDA
jgi:flagellar biosynthesis protein FlhG